MIFAHKDPWYHLIFTALDNVLFCGLYLQAGRKIPSPSEMKWEDVRLILVDPVHPIPRPREFNGSCEL